MPIPSELGDMDAMQDLVDTLTLGNMGIDAASPVLLHSNEDASSPHHAPSSRIFDSSQLKLSSNKRPGVIVIAGSDSGGPTNDALMILLPLLIVLSTLLFLLLLFLICVLILRRRRGIVLRDNDGPVDMSREELIDGEGGFEGVESRWLETVTDEERLLYRRAKEYQMQYPPNSQPTDITLSQFLSIQEKGVSAWSFEPDYESLTSLLVHSRTELTFLPDPATSSCVQSNLPLPKLNEVYYWEVKMFDLPETTTVAIGLATKPYPLFRLPGYNRYSVAYHSNGDKSHNYPFTASSFGPTLKEGDVLGVGYRPRTGTVFFTRNGRKLDDAYTGLQKWNLFPTVGADGPCSVHVNLGQSGFVFIEANVKKWGLAPSVGTLAPPPAYGSERGSILLEAGGQQRREGPANPPILVVPPSTSSHPRRQHRLRRPKPTGSTVPAQPSPLRHSPLSPPPPFSPGAIEEVDETAAASSSDRPYVSPTDAEVNVLPRRPSPLAVDVPSDGDEVESPHSDSSTSSSRTARDRASRQVETPLSPFPPNPPTPNLLDIHLQTLPSSSAGGSTRRDPPAYSPLNAYTYSEGVHLDLPADMIAAALEGGSTSTPSSPPPEQGRSRRRTGGR